MESLPRVSLAKDLRQVVRSGHPWLYDGALARKRPTVQPGEQVLIVHGGEALAVGFADPGAPIAVRVLSRNPQERIDHDWAAERAWQAARCRVADPLLAETNAFRVIHGENDYMPGLVVDLYADTAVVVFDGAAAAAFWQPFVPAVAEGLTRAGLQIARYWARPIKGSESEGWVLRGDEPPATFLIEESGARFEVDVRAGQKTGFFLDQRPNRRLVRDLSADAEVLNLFSYTAGFSVLAAMGGARRVTSVDVSRPAMEAARRNFLHNGLEPGDHGFVTEDAFDYLAGAAQRRELYDIVIVDPPSFAPNERSKPRALKAYTTLTRMALRTVQAGGWLVSASCSSHVTAQDMMMIVATASEQSGRRTRVQQLRGAGSDHPVLPAFPEGQYLKVLFVWVE